MPKLSGVVTTFNNAATIARCLASLTAICDDIVVLDSGSSDTTESIAAQFRARFLVQPFAGYAAQKTAAIALANNAWIVLLDSDEALDATAQNAIKQALSTEPSTAGFTLARKERVFWRYQHAASKHNQFLRVFDRRRAHISPHLVHESVRIEGAPQALSGQIIHDGDISIELKVSKLNRYSTLAADEKAIKAKSNAKLALKLRMTFYPLWYFLRAYIFRRQFLHGWAGYINSVELAHYAFLKYAKLFERQQQAPEQP
jgi:glycosyltransferase involved in cell wall biosynthesis